MGFALIADHLGTDLPQPESVVVPCAALLMGSRQAPPAAHHGSHRSKNHAPWLELPTPLAGSAWQQSVRRRTYKRN
jgi:hypothetical protein